jgi:Ulp1 family protease
MQNRIEEHPKFESVICDDPMLSLKDGEWLGDEICSYMLKLLLEREQVMCNDNPTKKRSSFHPSFFYTKITNVGHLIESGTYKFENVVKWSRKGHEGDIFSLDRLFVPINQDKRHWLVVVVVERNLFVRFPHCCFVTIV